MNAFLTFLVFIRVAANHRHVICKRIHWKIPEHIVTDVYISSYYFIQNARRDTGAEKEYDIVIKMTLEHALVQRFKKKEINEKSNI